MKLSLDALKLRAEAVASQDLLATISGGNENACHDVKPAGTSDFHTAMLMHAQNEKNGPVNQIVTWIFSWF